MRNTFAAAFVIVLLMVSLRAPFAMAQEDESGLEWTNQRATTLQERFVQQGRDEPWASDAETFLSEVYKTAGVSSSMVECHETLCKAILGLEFAEKFMNEVSPLMGSFATLGQPSDGSHGFSDFFILDEDVYVIYYTRSGYVLTEDNLVVLRSVYRSAFPDLK